MGDTLGYDEWSQSGVLLWPPRRFREELADSLYSFIRDDDEKFQSLGPGSAVSLDIYENLTACINRFIDNYMRETPPQNFGQWQDPPPRDSGVMLDRWQESDDGPFTTIEASHATNNPIAYPPPDGPTAEDPTEVIRRLHSGPGLCSEYIPDPLAARRRQMDQHLQSMVQVLGSSVAPTYPGEPPNSCSGNRVVGGATTTSSRPEPTSRRRNREATSLDENSSTITLESYRSKRVDTRTDKAKKSEYKHECRHCGQRFQFPARLKSHMETASHTTRRYRCETCSGVFTRHSSLMRHQSGETACKGARRTNGTSTLGSSSGVRSALHASAGSPSRTPYNTQNGTPLSDSSTDPITGYQQRPPVPVFYPSSPTNSRTTSRRNYSPSEVHAPSQPQGVRITQSSLSPRHKFIDPMMLGAPSYQFLT